MGRRDRSVRCNRIHFKFDQVAIMRATHEFTVGQQVEVIYARGGGFKGSVTGTAEEKIFVDGIRFILKPRGGWTSGTTTQGVSIRLVDPKKP